MKETVAGDPHAIRLAMPAAVAEGFAGLARGIQARSQILWGEHCSECAYPACYAACSFYEPRPGDLNCRRFEAGIERVATDGGAELTRIRFRKWGKLEGKGPAALRPLAQANKLERTDALVSRLLTDIPAPFALKRSLGWRWNLRKGRPPMPADAIAPDAFVVEHWSPSGAVHGFTLTFLEQGSARRMFQTRFEVGPAYGRLSVPVALIARSVDLGADWLVQIEPIGEAQGVEAVFGLVDFVAGEAIAKTATPAATGDHPLAKVVVWDLDETLWTGTLAEDGAAGVTPRPEAVEAIRRLDERGVLQSIASKNDLAEALAALKGFGLDDYFLHPQVGWGPKSGSVAAIAKALDLGLDSFVFIDDQPFERAEVTSAHPRVRSLAHTAVEGLADHPWFDHPVTPESRGRRASYRAEAKRTAVYQEAGGDYLAFLRSSDITLDIAPLSAADATRVHELSQRTNQLNFNGAKFDRAAVEAMAAPDPDRERLVLRCADRFGDYGLIGFADLDARSGELVDLFMSCRVQRKRVEHALFARLAATVSARGHGWLRVRFTLTERNGASAQMLADLGFEAGPADTGGRVVWKRSSRHPFTDADIVRIATRSSEAA